jgi:predicted nucleic acid-binding protein
MIVLDTDVLALHHFFATDPRHASTSAFMERTRTTGRGTTLYNLLEFAGILSSAGKPDVARKMIQVYATATDMTLLYPLLPASSPELFFADYTAELMDTMERGLRYGDAKILWVAEANDASALVTWNTRHYQGKTPVEIVTPEDYLKSVEP